jgi:hypothetical protein
LFKSVGQDEVSFVSSCGFLHVPHAVIDYLASRAAAAALLAYRKKETTCRERERRAPHVGGPRMQRFFFFFGGLNYVTLFFTMAKTCGF